LADRITGMACTTCKKFHLNNSPSLLWETGLTESYFGKMGQKNKN